MNNTDNMRIVRLCVLITLLAIAVIAGLWFGGSVDKDQQGALYEGLRTTATIIFGVVGAWIAIVYPDALRNILDRSKGDESMHLAVIRRLLLSIFISTIVLAVILIGSPAAAVLCKSEVYSKYESRFLSVSFTLLLVLTVVEFWALILSLIPLGIAEITAARETTRKKVVRHSSSLTQNSNENDENQQK